MTSWIYGDYDLVKQFIEGGQTLKQWLEAQGSTFVEDTQPTLIGALWYRENEFVGATIDGVDYPGRWGTYFKAPMNTVLATSETAASNKIMLRTTAEELIVEDGRVTGVKATQYDGTPVTAHATKGVVIATGGYAANLQMVVDTNVYWSSDYLSTSTKTTNRSSLKGDGITMAQAVGADVTGMGYTQMMPISWIDDGNLAFGGASLNESIDLFYLAAENNPSLNTCYFGVSFYTLRAGDSRNRMEAIGTVVKNPVAYMLNFDYNADMLGELLLRLQGVQTGATRDAGAWEAIDSVDEDGNALPVRRNLIAYAATLYQNCAKPGTLPAIETEPYIDAGALHQSPRFAGRDAGRNTRRQLLFPELGKPAASGGAGGLLCGKRH